MRNSQLSNTIYHNIPINSTPEKVFGAISQPDQLVNWWPLKCSGKPELGAEYNLNFTDAYNWYGKVAKVEKNRLFFIKMTRSDADWDPTTFGFEIELKDQGVWLKFCHSDWPEANDHFKHSSYCWAILLNGLKKYVEKGVVIPFEERS